VIIERLFYHVARKELDSEIFDYLFHVAAHLLNTVDEKGIPDLMWSIDNGIEDLVNGLDLGDE
jgi:hypothetical protein